MTAVPVAQPQAPSASASRRLLYIDNLRWVLISLVVMGHLAITYGVEGDWYYKEPGAVSEVFAIIALPIAAVLYASLLGLFVLIAGYFTPPAHDMKGTGPFMLDRAKRLLIPLALYEFIINPIISYIRDVHETRFAGSFWSYFGLWFSPLKSIGDGPVWFLEMLFVFSLAYAAWRFLRARGRKGGASAVRPVPGNGSIALFALALGLVTFVVRLWAPTGKWYEPWHQEFAHYPQYILMFALGALAFRSDWLTRFPDRQARLWRWLIPLILVSLIGIALAAGAATGKLDERAAGGPYLLSLAYSLWEGFTCVAIVIVMLTWFRSRFNRQNRLTRELANCCFGVYVIHPLVIVPLAIALSGVTMNLSLKFLWVTPLALTICYGLVYLLRKIPGVRSVL
jgi:fucose 4-O-acetylase-like acetyltransferase